MVLPITGRISLGVIEGQPLNSMTACEVLASDGEFSNFVRALELSGVGDMLEKKGPYTVFAPNDDAFNIETLGLMLSQTKLMHVLHHYIVPGKYEYANLEFLPGMITVIGYPLIIKNDMELTVNGARIIRPDMPYNKGIIHEIDSVLWV